MCLLKQKRAILLAESVTRDGFAGLAEVRLGKVVFHESFSEDWIGTFPHTFESKTWRILEDGI